MTKTVQFFLLTAILIAFISTACNNDDDGTGGETPIDEIESITMYSQFSSDVEVSTEGDFVILKSTGVPNHPSPYFAQTDSRYEAYNGTNLDYNKNPNRIEEQSFEFILPLNPEKAATTEATPLGPIGISINGVPLYNQYAGPNNQPLTNEINSFDQYDGHPQNSGQYHYHLEPSYLTGQNGSDALIGVLLDGFPVYGPVENGAAISNDDLDEYHGHFGVTPEFPDGIYHYHFTNEAPYLNGDGFYGTSGTVSN